MSEFEYTTEHGKNIRIAVAPFEVAGRLKTLVVKELKNSNVNFGALIKEMNEKAGQDTSSLSADAYTGMAQSILSVISSPDVEKALFACLIKSTYDDASIKPETFDDIEAREEYFKIVSLCLKLNVMPFFKKLGAVLNLLV